MAETRGGRLDVVGHHVRAAARIAPGRPAVWLGLRAAAATALPLALSPWLDPVVAAWAPLAGFGIALVDKGGAYGARARLLGATALGSVLAVVLGSLAGGHGAATIAAVTLGLTACALGQAGGAPGAALGNTIAVQLIVAWAVPLGPGQLGARVEGYALGAGLALVLALVVWPVRVYKPARRAVAALLQTLAEQAAAIARAGDGGAWRDLVLRRHRELRDRLEVARATLVATRRGRRGESGRGERLLAMVQLGDQLLGALVALEEVLDAGVPAATMATVTAGLAQLAAALDELSERVLVESRQAPARTPAWAAADDGSHARELIARAHGYRRLLDELVDSLVDDAEPLPAGVAVSPRERVPLAFDLDSAIVRHALRVAVATLAATSIAHALHLRYGYWVTMTAYLLMQPARAGTTVRAVQRVAGTVAGAIVAAAIAWAVRDPLGVMIVVVVLAGLSASVLQLNYLLYATLLTPTFVLLAELHTQDFSLIGTRVANTALGGAIALVAGALLWPAREEVRFAERLARALEASARYVGAVVAAVAGAQPVPSPAIVQARRRFGLALNNAELALDRVIADRAADLEPRMAQITFARRLGSAINGLGATRAIVEPGPHAAALTGFGVATEARLAALAQAIRTGGPAPVTAPPAPLDEPLLAARLARIELALAVLAEATTRAAQG